MNGDDDTLLLLHAYVDGELSPSEALVMERRLTADPELQLLANRLSIVSAALGATLASVPVSETLRGRVMEAVGFADKPRPRRWDIVWQPLAAALLLGFLGGGLLGSGAVYLRMAPAMSDPSEAVLSGHLRSLAAPLPFDIASSDRHVVKPWFNGRTTIAPEAPDLADKGSPLVGGRIDIVAGSPVPTLVYHHDRHVISVTITTRTTGARFDEERRGGSTIERWDSGDLSYWAVSDLNVTDLRAFVQQFRSRTTPSG